MKKLLTFLMLLGIVCHAQNPKFQSVTIIGSGSGQSTVLSSTNSGTLLVNGVPSGQDPRITGSGTISLPSVVTLFGPVDPTTSGSNAIVYSGTTLQSQEPQNFGYLYFTWSETGTGLGQYQTTYQLRTAFSQDLINIGGLSNVSIYSGSSGQFGNASGMWFQGKWWAVGDNAFLSSTSNPPLNSQFSVINSTDTTHWNFVSTVSDASLSGTILHTYAPEFFMETGGTDYTKLHVLVSINVSGTEGVYILNPTSNALTSWGNPVGPIFTRNSNQGLDPFMVETGGTFNLFTAGTQGGGAIQINRSTTLTGSYATLSTSNMSVGEGPDVVQIGPTNWWMGLSLDITGTTALQGTWYSISNDNFATWSNIQQCPTDGYAYDHGTMVPITNIQQLSSIISGMANAPKDKFDVLMSNNIQATGTLTTYVGGTGAGVEFNGGFVTPSGSGQVFLGTPQLPFGQVNTSGVQTNSITGNGVAIFGNWEFNGAFLTGTTAGTGLFFGTSGSPIPNANITNLAIIGSSKIVIGSGTLTLTGTGATASTVTSGTGTETFPISTGTLLNTLTGASISGSGTVVVPSGTLSVTVSSLSGTGAIAGTIPDQSKLIIGNPSNLPAGAIPTPVITASGTVVVTVTSGLGLTGTNTMVVPSGTYHYGVLP